MHLDRVLRLAPASLASRNRNAPSPACAGRAVCSSRRPLAIGVQRFNQRVRYHRAVAHALRVGPLVIGERRECPSLHDALPTRAAIASQSKEGRCLRLGLPRTHRRADSLGGPARPGVARESLKPSGIREDFAPTSSTDKRFRWRSNRRKRSCPFADRREEQHCRHTAVNAANPTASPKSVTSPTLRAPASEQNSAPIRTPCRVASRNAPIG